MCDEYGFDFDPDEAPPRFEDLSPDYRTAWNIYLKVRNQLIFNPVGTPIGLNVLAIDTIFKFYKVPTKKHAVLFEKINIIYDEHMLITAPPKEE